MKYLLDIISYIFHSQVCCGIIYLWRINSLLYNYVDYDDHMYMEIALL